MQLYQKQKRIPHSKILQPDATIRSIISEQEDNQTFKMMMLFVPFRQTSPGYCSDHHLRTMNKL